MAAMDDSSLSDSGRHLLVYACELGEDNSKRQVGHTWVGAPPLEVSMSRLRH